MPGILEFARIPTALAGTHLIYFNVSQLNGVLREDDDSRTVFQCVWAMHVFELCCLVLTPVIVTYQESKPIFKY